MSRWGGWSWPCSWFRLCRTPGTVMPYVEALDSQRRRGPDRRVPAYCGSVAFIHARISVALGSRSFDHWPGEGESQCQRPTEADYWLWFPGLGLGDVKLLGMIGAVRRCGRRPRYDPRIIGDRSRARRRSSPWLVARSGEPFGFAPAIALGAIASLFLPPALAAHAFLAATCADPSIRLLQLPSPARLRE